MPGRLQDIENEPFVEELVKSLVDVYGTAKQEIMTLLAKSSLTGFQQARLNALLKQVRTVVEKLDVAAAQFGATGIPKAYRAGQNIAAQALRDIDVKDTPRWDARIHTSAVDVIAQQMAIDALEKNGTIYSNVARALQKTKQQALTETQINQQIAAGIIQGETRVQTSRKIADAITEQLGEGKLIMAGKRLFTPEEYAELLARTRTREAVTEGIINSSAQVGMDLFQVSVHDNPCPVCRQYQGRIFSLSGENENFPKLATKPPFHPRCKHVVVPVTENHLKRKGLFDAARALNDPSVEIPDHAAYVAFLEQHPQVTPKTQPRTTPAPPPQPPKPPTVDAIPRGQAGAADFGARLVPVEGKTLGGSTGARLFVDDEGTQWVVKQYAGNELQARNEYLANRIYALNNVSVPEARLAEFEGKTAVALRFVDVRGAVTAGSKYKGELAQSAFFRKGFATDAFVANWDVVGLAYDNAMLVPGKPSRVWRLDQGGSLLFRAQGGPKGGLFGPGVGELATLRDPMKNPQAASVFGSVADGEVLKQLTTLLRNVTPAKIAAAIDDAGIVGAAAEQLSGTLIERRKYLAQYAKRLRNAQEEAAVLAAGRAGKPGERRMHAHATTAKSSLELDRSFAAKNDKLDQQQLGALRGYTSIDYVAMNRNAWQNRVGNKPLDELLWGDDLPGFEGYSQRQIKDVPGREEQMKKWMSGEWAEVDWAAYSSSTIRPKAVFSDDGGFTFIIKNKGAQGAYVGHYSRFANEKEVLFGRNSKFRVVGWDIRGKRYFLFLEEVDGAVPLTQPKPSRIRSKQFMESWEKEYAEAYGDTSKLKVEEFKK